MSRRFRVQAWMRGPRHPILWVVGVAEPGYLLCVHRHWDSALHCANVRANPLDHDRPAE